MSDWEGALVLALLFSLAAANMKTRWVRAVMVLASVGYAARATGLQLL